MLLDTCALVWLVSGGGELSGQARKAIEDEPMVYVSAISAFEVAWKHATGGIELPCDPEKWYREALNTHDLVEVPITGDIAVAATKLPLIHRDPCDRFIIATARLNGWPIVTRDERFGEYGVDLIG